MPRQNNRGEIKAMNITVIYASGRGGRSCSRGIAGMLVDELMSGENGEVFEFDLPDDMPHICRGCGACINGREEKCGGYAAMQPAVAAMEHSDVIIFSSPVYVYHVPGQMKTLLDHMAYRWMVHRPNLSFMKKQAVVITTAAGGGMRSAAGDIKDSTQYWGVARTHVITQSVWNHDWKDMPERFRKKAEKNVRKTARRIKRRERRLTPSAKVKCIFYIYRALHRHRKMTAADDDYWYEKGYITGRPWDK